MKKKNPYSSLGYRSIACGCILDFIQKEKNLNPSKSDKRFCYEYAKKQYPDDSEGVLKKNRIIFLLILIGLPILIFIDSKIRLGRFSWGWAFMSLIITIGTMVAVANIFKSLKGLEQGQIISILIGSIVGAYVGGFTLYRAMSRRREKKDSGQAKS
ncbi:MAG: hypothetical protein GY705_02385 [Bacteroidetes bacterium]|nr:hypothetical protein [Bacteroidota bacterium]